MTWIWIIIAIVVVGGLWYLMKGKKKETPKSSEGPTSEEPTNPQV